MSEQLPDPMVDTGWRARLLALLERIAIALEQPARRVLKERPAVADRFCAYAPCGKQFNVRHPRQRFCSSTCRSYAYEVRNGNRDGTTGKLIRRGELQ